LTAKEEEEEGVVGESSLPQMTPVVEFLANRRRISSLGNLIARRRMSEFCLLAFPPLLLSNANYTCNRKKCLYLSILMIQ
jgi:hypothetical protein